MALENGFPIRIERSLARSLAWSSMAGMWVFVVFVKVGNGNGAQCVTKDTERRMGSLCVSVCVCEHVKWKWRQQQQLQSCMGSNMLLCIKSICCKLSNMLLSFYTLTVGYINSLCYLSPSPSLFGFYLEPPVLCARF